MSLISAKYLIINDYKLIKEIASENLTHCPIKNSILIKNDTHRFIKNLLKNHRSKIDSVKILSKTKEGGYLNKYSDAKEYLHEDFEFPSYYHLRTPSLIELEKVIKDNPVTRFLIDNNISTEKIARIVTCYDEDNVFFQEEYIVKSLSAKYLIIKNISDSSLELKNLDILYNEGILFNKSKINNKSFINLYDTVIKQEQAIIIPLGLYLNEFVECVCSENLKTIDKINFNKQTYTLYEGNLLGKREIQYIGNCITPLNIHFRKNENDYNEVLSEFSFDSLYWI